YYIFPSFMMKILQSSKSFLSLCFLVSVVVFSPVVSIAQTQSSSKAQTIDKGEAVEKLWQDNSGKWGSVIKKKVHATDQDFKLFLKFNQTKFIQDKNDFFRAAFQDKMDLGSISVFFANLTKKYIPLYNDFVTIKHDYPSS